MLGDGSENEKLQSNLNKRNQIVQESSPAEQFMEKKPTSTIANPTSKTISLNNADNNHITLLINDNLQELEGGHFRCRICGQDSTGMTKTRKGDRKNNMKNHIETHVEGLSISCEVCGKEFRSRNSYSVHKSLYHKRK